MAAKNSSISLGICIFEAREARSSMRFHSHGRNDQYAGQCALSVSTLWNDEITDDLSNILGVGFVFKYLPLT